MADNIKLVTKEYVDTGLSTKANKVISNMSYESFIDTYNLREPEWVDLSFVGGEYYYTDFNTAVTDVNNGNTANATSNITGAVCQIFTDGNITVLRLLSDITITTPIIFTKSVIFDLNGFTTSCSVDGHFGDKSVVEIPNITVVFYGSKTDSKIQTSDSSTEEIQFPGLIILNSKRLYVLGGSYKRNAYSYKESDSYVILNPYTNFDSYIDIYNASIESYSESSTKKNRCIGAFATTGSMAFNMYNTTCISKSINYASTAIVLNNQNPTTKVLISDCNIEASGADKGDNSSIGITIKGTTTNNNIILKNSTIKGHTSAVQNGGTLYINNCKTYAPSHGGIYNGTSGILYAENTEFHRNTPPEGFVVSGWACAYFGYGSVAYIDNCKFIRDVESDTSPGIAVKAITAGAVTRVFVSNSEMPGIRCDADQEIYLGNGISDAIKNATVQGKKYITDNNYVYIEDKGAYSLLNPDFNAADKNYVDNNVGNITTTEAEEHAQIDSTEILTAQTGTWVTDGWTGDATTGFTHTSGNTSILKYPITGSDYIAEGTLYDITFSCSVAPTVDNIMVRIGNSNLFNLYGQEEPLNIGVKSKGSTDGTIYLEFIPSSTFTGTISNIKVHKITGTYVGKYKITDSNDSISFEVRANTVNKYNAFIGVDSGSYNTTGNGNVGFGYKALASNTSGFWNTGIGFEALQFVNAGSRNIGIGALAGRHIETGQRNVAIGTHTLRENRTGNYNIAIGADSQLNGKSGNSNISIGGSSLYYIDGGNENIAIGHNAIAANNTENKGNYNIAIGFNSLTYGSNSLDNIAIGRNAGYRITGSNNVIIGTDSGRRGNSQVVMGANSGKNLQDDATENTIIGYYTGNNLKANKNCILIGNRVDGEETGDYQLNIGNLIKGSTQSSNKYVNIDGSLSAKSMSVDNVGTNDTDVVNKKYVDDAITTQVSSVYKAKGSIADISALPTPDKAHEGFVYNIENEFTTTDQFVEGAGTTFPAGTNVVCINTTGTTYKWDVLAGMVDLSDYATKTELSGKLDKVTSTSTYNRLYGIETTGNQALFNVAAYVLAGSIAQRKADGTLSATTPTADSSDDTVTTKKYVDDQIGNINSILATMFNDVSTQSDEEPTDEEVIA